MKIIFKICILLTSALAFNLPSQDTQANPLLGLTQAAATGWVENDYVRTRLVSSHLEVAYDPTVLQYLGWEIEMKKPGWKTYWRTPGEAGIPPTFNWQGSSNLSVAEVLFPRPERFQIFGIQTFGYGERLILPIRIEPNIGGSPINIKMRAEFMSCKEICIPFSADYELSLPAPKGEAGLERNISSYAQEIRESVLRVPVPNGVDKLALNLAGISLRGEAGDQKLSITLEGEHHLAGADVFIEAQANFMFGAPQKQLQADGKSILIVFPVHNLTEPVDLEGQELTLTMHDGWGFSRQQNLIVK